MSQNQDAFLLDRLCQSTENTSDAILTSIAKQKGHKKNPKKQTKSTSIIIIIIFRIKVIHTVTQYSNYLCFLFSLKCMWWGSPSFFIQLKLHRNDFFSVIESGFHSQGDRILFLIQTKGVIVKQVSVKVWRDVFCI